MLSRQSGLLLHVTSLPGPYGIGDAGPAAYRFAERLAAAGQKLWQVLPLVPPGLGRSPYASASTFALSPLLISPERLRADGLLTDADLAGAPNFPDDRVDWDAAVPYRMGLLDQAFARFDARKKAYAADFGAFCEANDAWLSDYALFMALRDAHDGAQWIHWPAPLRDRDPDALAKARKRLSKGIRKHSAWQFLAERHWRDLHAFVDGLGLTLVGDLPIYVAHDSADAWAAPGLFKLSPGGEAAVVSGVPPDPFSPIGQKWGNPLYRWFALPDDAFMPPPGAFANADAYGWWEGQPVFHGAALNPLAIDWWTRRMARVLALVDLVRLDHFRGFAGYWEVVATAPDARSGYWLPGPGRSLFDALATRLGPLPLIAEDLGIITPDVTALMQALGLPGMGVMQFGFDGERDGNGAPKNVHHPANFGPDTVAYTGTHDNDTLGGWLASPASAVARAEAGLPDGADGVGPFVGWALHSGAGTVILPLQDVLGLGSEARMNTPGEASGQWAWRLREGAFTDGHAAALREMTHASGRT